MQHSGQRVPIAILSFNRPTYLREVLLSLRPQVDKYDCIYLFQDGAWNPYSGQSKAHPVAISTCIDIFREILPWGIVAASDRNLGVAENYERAEQEIFGRLQSQCAVFLEDDLVLSPNFLPVTLMLLDLARREPRISYVSAYGHLWAALPEQKLRERELIHMHENWGFAMTRKAWLAERPFRHEYLRFVEGRDYTQRDDESIISFYKQRGWETTLTSQDVARWIASLELGKVRLTTFPCHARNIGRVGVHVTEAFYDQAKLGSSIFFPDRPRRPEPPTEAQFALWLDTERRRFTTEPHPFYFPHATGMRKREPSM